jgi:hypothetical protein
MPRLIITEGRDGEYTTLSIHAPDNTHLHACATAQGNAYASWSDGETHRSGHGRPLEAIAYALGYPRRLKGVN